MNLLWLTWLFGLTQVVSGNFECTSPISLGLENGVLPDSSFTASSYSTSREPWRARLKGQFGKNKLIKEII